MQQGAHQVVLVIEQGRGVQPDGPAPQEVASCGFRDLPGDGGADRAGRRRCPMYDTIVSEGARQMDKEFMKMVMSRLNKSVYQTPISRCLMIINLEIKVVIKRWSASRLFGIYRFKICICYSVNKQ